jgi:hypothetical protein
MCVALAGSPNDETILVAGIGRAVTRTAGLTEFVFLEPLKEMSGVLIERSRMNGTDMRGTRST